MFPSQVSYMYIYGTMVSDPLRIRNLEFYFNATGAMVGKLILDDEGKHDGDIPVIATRFLATRFCPSGQVDKPVQKFTGNDVIGKASDKLTTAIHAFAHFTLVYSHDEILFADLQGDCYC
jgi:hypothetical protein